MSFTPHIIAIVILVVCSSYFSGTEIAFTAVRAERIREKYEKKKSTPLRFAVYFLSHFDDMLATILIGNNVANQVASSISTVIVVGLLGESYTWVATLAMTVIILIFGEVLPKSLGKTCAEFICAAAAVPLRVLSVILHPAVLAVNFLVDKIARCWRRLAVTDETISEGELSSVMDIVESEGVIDGDHATLVKRAIDYKDIRAYEIITPRVDVEYIDINDSGSDIIEQALSSTHSRLPVCDGDVDSIIGVLHLNKFLFRLESGEIAEDSVADAVRSLCLTPIFIPRTTPIHSAVDLMRERQQQLVFVVDSYGGVMGILTMEDALEVIVGDIWDESDKIEPDIVKTGEGTYDLSAQTRLRELFSELSIGHDDSDEIVDEYTVLGGWCSQMLGIHPEIGDSFTYGRLTFTVRTLSDRMPDRISLTVAVDDGGGDDI